MKEKERKRLFITFRKCSIAALAAKRIEMASGSLWARSGLDSNKIEMDSGLLWARFGLVTGSIRTHPGIVQS